MKNLLINYLIKGNVLILSKWQSNEEKEIFIFIHHLSINKRQYDANTCEEK